MASIRMKRAFGIYMLALPPLESIASGLWSIHVGSTNGLLASIAALATGLGAVAAWAWNRPDAPRALLPLWRCSMLLGALAFFLVRNDVLAWVGISQILQACTNPFRGSAGRPAMARPTDGRNTGSDVGEMRNAL